MSKIKDGRGFILGYLLFALALLVATTFYTYQTLGKQDTAKWIASTKDKLESQANLISSQLSVCLALLATDTTSSVAESYPAGQGVDVSALTCPVTQANLWDSATGSPAPESASGFDVWRYTKITDSSDSTSATVYVSLVAFDSLGKPVLNGLRARLGMSMTELSSTSSTNDTFKVYFLKP